jgi:hypothetical protein
MSRFSAPRLPAPRVTDPRSATHAFLVRTCQMMSLRPAQGNTGQSVHLTGLEPFKFLRGADEIQKALRLEMSLDRSSL